MRNDPALRPRGVSSRRAMRVSAAALIAAVCVYFVVQTESPQAAVEPLAVEPLAVDVEPEKAAPAFALTAIETEPQRLVTEEPPVVASEATGTKRLRVILEGIRDEDARLATITLRGVKDDDWLEDPRDSWPCQGLTSELDLDPFFAHVADQDLRVDGLWVEVDHPQHFIEGTQVSLSRGEEPTAGRTVYEARLTLIPPVFWPEITLSVRDAHTRAHLANVELSCVTTLYMGTPRQPGTPGIFTPLGDGLSSPIVLRGGRKADDPEARLAGFAMGPASGEAPPLFELWHNGRPKPGQEMVVYARAPGYRWGSIAIDVSETVDRELLLEPGAATLGVQLTNVQPERYAPHETPGFFSTWFKAEGQESWFGSNVGSPLIRVQRLDESHENAWFWMEGLDPGQYRVQVELGGIFSWGQDKPLLAGEELTLAAGETRQLLLTLADPPAPPERAAFGGTVSLPTFAGEDTVRLRLYHESSGHRAPHAELALADMEPVTGRLPTWSFHAEDLPVGLYQLTLLPFLTSWMVELPAGGRGDVTLVVPELAEVLVETVDAHTGERIPFDQIYYRNMDVLPDLHQNNWTRAEPESPGRYRFWMAPGSAHMWSREVPSGLDYGERSMDLELVAGFQSVRFEFEPVYAFRIELREGGVVVPGFDPIWGELLRPQNLRAVDHDGLPTSLGRFAEKRLVEVSAPGLYEVSFEGVGADRFHPIPPRLVDVRAGETAEVIVELHRK